MDRSEFISVINKVADALQVARSEQLVKNVISFCKSKDLRLFKSRYSSSDELTSALSSMYLEHINDTDEPMPDSHLDLSKIAMEGSAELISPKDKCVSVFLDSRHRDKSSYTPGQKIKLFEYFVNQNSGSNRTPGQVSVNGKLSNIKSFELQRMAIPYPTHLQNLNTGKTITLLFTNLSANSVINPISYHHFSFTYQVSSYDDQVIILNPMDKKKVFEFNPPLRTLDRLSLQFSDPYEPIEFDPDVIIPSSVNYVNSDGRIDFATEHGLSDGDVIVISNFYTTDDLSYATILSSIMNKRGLQISIIDNYSIAINVNLSLLSDVAIPDMIPNIEVISRTFRFDLKIKYHASETSE